MKPKTFIIKARKRLGLKQKDLADLLKTHRCNISNYEIGRVIPPATIILDIQELLDKEEPK